MLKEFKEFIMKGNVLDLAVAVIIAGAFGLIVSSFINDVLMPPIGMALGGMDFSDLSMILQEANESTGVEEVALRWGAFVNTIINFVIIAFVIFMIVKAANKAKRKEEEAPAPAPAGPTSEELLTEIRDLLKKD